MFVVFLFWFCFAVVAYYFATVRIAKTGRTCRSGPRIRDKCQKMTVLILFRPTGNTAIDSLYLILVLSMTLRFAQRVAGARFSVGAY